MCEFYRVLVCVCDIEGRGHADYSVCFFEELVGCCGGRRARLPRRDCGACIFVLENLIKI